MNINSTQLDVQKEQAGIAKCYSLAYVNAY